MIVVEVRSMTTIDEVGDNDESVILAAGSAHDPS
jgi:hypothetical protein